MTSYFNALVEVINSLRAKGLVQQAAELDKFLRKNAQELVDPLADLEAMEKEMGAEEEQPEAPVAPIASPQKEPTDEKLQRTLFYQYEKWHSVLDRELPKFGYLGKNNISAIRSAAANVHKMLQLAFQNKPTDYDKQAVEKWNVNVDQLVERIHKSQGAKLDSTKAIVDAHLLYDTTNRLYESFQRVCGNSEFATVIQEFGSLIHTFTNVIKSTSEQISETDLTKVR